MSLRTEKDEIETPREEKVFSVLQPRIVKLTNRTEIDVRRTLPHKQLRMIGAWCFIDHYGPTHQVSGMTIGAHPHMGLQTVTWLFEGTILHSDSLGTTQEISPSQLNLMTAGSGIAHSEQSLEKGRSMHGVQLWIALPQDSRNCAPEFEHLSQLPSAIKDDSTVTVFIGTYGELASKATIFSDLVGAEFSSDAETVELNLNSLFEHGILNVGDTFTLNGEEVRFGELAYVPVGHTAITIKSASPKHWLLLGGVPFEEKILMWWNFIARTHEEIVEARQRWNSHDSSIPNFSDNINVRIPAPELPKLRLNPR